MLCKVAFNEITGILFTKVKTYQKRFMHACVSKLQSSQVQKLFDLVPRQIVIKHNHLLIYFLNQKKNFGKNNMINLILVSKAYLSL